MRILTDKESDMNRKASRDEEELFSAVWLSHMPLLGPVTIGKLLEMKGSFGAIRRMNLPELEETGLLNEGMLTAWRTAPPDEERCRKDIRRMRENGIRMVTILDEDFPERLRPIRNCPVWLYVKGELPRDDVPSMAIIGARACTAYGKAEAEFFGKLLAEHGIQVISGMATGADGYAQRGAVAAGGSTFAVLGSGVNVCYPRSNYDLYRRIPGDGGIISEYPLDCGPAPQHFPVRNRLISGLADAVLVIEAERRSGSLITADLALEQGREIFALPGRRVDSKSAGCNRLIRVGAAIVTEAQDVLDFFQIKGDKNDKDVNNRRVPLAKSEKMVYSAIDSRPVHVGEIMQETSLSPGECLRAIWQLEDAGLIAETGNQYYIRKPAEQE